MYFNGDLPIVGLTAAYYLTNSLEEESGPQPTMTIISKYLPGRNLPGAMISTIRKGHHKHNSSQIPFS